MAIPAIGKKAPAINLPATGVPATGMPATGMPATGDKQEKVRLSALLGQQVVVYFYPRDNTPGCTTESAEFAAAVSKFKRANTIILGVSQDTLASHEKFSAKLALPFALLSDEAGTVCEKFGVLKLKKMYGKEFVGIERSTFLIDAKGVLQQEWRKVKVPGHVDEVLIAAKALNKA